MATRSKSPKPPTPKQEAASVNTSRSRLSELARASIELARAVAKNESADPDLLRELASSSDQKTRFGVATNPNTPTDVLLKLGAQFPGQLLGNPVFPLLILENPNLLADIPTSTLRSLLKRDAVPEAFLEWVAERHESTNFGVLLAVAMNPNTPKSALSKLTQSENPDVALAASLHVNWVGEMSSGWDEAARAAMKTTNLYHNREKEAQLWGVGAIADIFLPVLSLDIRLEVASNPNALSNLLQQLVGDEDKEVRQLVSQNPNTPAYALEQLVGDRDKEVREFVAYYPNTPLPILQQFQVQHEAIKNLDTSPDTLRELATSHWEVIHLGIARHPNTPQSVLEQLALKQDWQFRVAVALNLNTSSSTLEQLAQDRDWEVRWAVAQNPNTPVSLLEQLAGDEENHVRDAVEENLSQPAIQKPRTSGIIQQPNLIPYKRYAPDGVARMVILSTEIDAAHGVYKRRLALHRPSTPEQVAEQTAARGGWQWRANVTDFDTPASVLEQLAGSSDTSDRREVASHHNTPITVIEQLAGDEDTNVRHAVANNPNTPARILQQLATDSKDYVRDAAIAILCQNVVDLNSPDSILELAEIKDSRLGIAIARHPNTPAIVLEQLAEHQNEKVRTVVAKNPNTPAIALEKLVVDENRYVSEAALANLSQNYPQFNPPGSILEQIAQVKDPETPQDILEKLATSKSVLLREGTARHPNAPTSVLEQLARDKNSVVRRAVAQNPHTPERLLERLVGDKDKEVAIAVASNPNTPVSILEQLAQKKRNKQLSYAALKNLLSKNPDRAVVFLEGYVKSFEPSFTRLLVFLNPLAPSSSLAKSFRSSSWLERYAIAANPNTAIAIRQRLAQDGNRVVRAAANANLASQLNSGSLPMTTSFKSPQQEAASVTTSPERLQVLATQTSDKKVLLAIAMNAQTTKPTLEVLSRSKHRQVAEAARLHVNWAGEITQGWEEIVTAAIRTTELKKNVAELDKLGSLGAIPTFILEQLWRDKNSEIREVVAKAPNTPASILEQLARREVGYILTCIAQNPNTPMSILEQLAEDKDETVLWGLAQNPNAPADVVEEFQRFQLTRQMAKNLETPQAELEVLAQSEWESIRAAVARNPNTPVSALEQLVADNLKIRNEIKAIARHPDTPLSRLEKLAALKDAEIRTCVALNPNTPMHLMIELAWSERANDIVRKAFAQNPNTPASILEQLAADQNIYVRTAVAQNPNTPASILGQLAADQNIYVRTSVAQNPNTPASILEQLAADQDTDVHQYVACNPNTPVSVLERLMEDLNFGVRCGVAGNPNTPVSILERLMGEDALYINLAIAKNPNPPVRLLGQLAEDTIRKQRIGDLAVEIAQNPKTPASSLEQLAAATNCAPPEYEVADYGRVCQAIAKNPNTPISILEQMAFGPYAGYSQSYYRDVVAQNPNIPVRILEQLVNDQDYRVRYCVAQNPNTPASSLALLAGDVNSKVRYHVAQNPNTSVSCLVQLAGDTVLSVRQTVALNPNISISVLQQVEVAHQLAENHTTSQTELETLALSEWEWIHEAVASNPNTPVATLEKLAADKVAWIAQHCQNSEYGLSQVGETIKLLAENPNTPASGLEKLLEVLKQPTLVNQSHVRSAIARHPNSPVSFLEQLATDERPYVRQGVASNPNTPITLLEKLVTDESPYVRQGVAENPNTPITLLEKLVGDRESNVRSVAIERYLAQYPQGLPVVLATYAKTSIPTFSRFLVLLHSETPTTVLAKNFRSLEWLERYAIATNPKTPTKTLECLVVDGNSFVRAAAKANLQQRSFV